MSIMQDLACLVGDAARLSGIFVQNKLERQLLTIKRNIARVVACSAVMLTGGVLVLIGLAYVIWGLFSLLAEVISPGGSALIIGGAVIVVALIIMAVAVSCMQKK